MLLDKRAITRLVNDQLETLLKKGYASVAKKYDPYDKDAKPAQGMTTVEFLSWFQMFHDLCHKWKPIEIPKGHIPALVTVPLSLVSAKEQLEKGGIGHSWGDDPEVGEIRDHQKDSIPRKPYLLVDIGIEALGHNFSPDGIERLELDKTARGWYKGQNMLTLPEGIALATHFPRRITRQYHYELAGSFHRPPFDPENCSLEEIERLADTHASATYWLPRDRRMFLSRLNDGKLWLAFFNYRARIEASWAFPVCKMRIDPHAY